MKLFWGLLLFGYGVGMYGHFFGGSFIELFISSFVLGIGALLISEELDNE